MEEPKRSKTRVSTCILEAMLKLPSDVRIVPTNHDETITLMLEGDSLPDAEEVSVLVMDWGDRNVEFLRFEPRMSVNDSKPKTVQCYHVQGLGYVPTFDPGISE